MHAPAIVNSQSQVLPNIDGTVKWYRASKGYGFIVPARRLEVAGDILVHESVARSAGVEALFDKQKIVCDAVIKPRGLNAVRIELREPILSGIPNELDNIPSNHLLNNFPVKLIDFNSENGYGFLIPRDSDPADASQHIFVHAKVLIHAGLSKENARPGMLLFADVWLNRPAGNGCMALAVRSSIKEPITERPVLSNGKVVGYEAFPA